MVPQDKLDRLITIERPIAKKGLNSAGSGSWEPVTKVWANVKDMLPSRGERLADGINVTTRPARVRMRYREDIGTEMRFVMGSRVMQIVAGPAEIGRRYRMEFMVEDYSPAGNSA
jgi:head-tail adaptor